jgi:DNA mismatch repair protein MSH2
MNLFSVLNKCRTPMGTRRLMQWIKQPLLSVPDIGTLVLCAASLTNPQRSVRTASSFSMTILSCARLYTPSMAHLVHLAAADFNIRHLKGIPDLSRIAKKFQKGRAGLADCMSVYNFAKRLPELRDLLLGYSGF